MDRRRRGDGDVTRELHVIQKAPAARTPCQELIAISCERFPGGAGQGSDSDFMALAKGREIKKNGSLPISF